VCQHHVVRDRSRERARAHASINLSQATSGPRQHVKIAEARGIELTPTRVSTSTHTNPDLTSTYKQDI
jgi:hypothetical protein